MKESDYPTVAPNAVLQKTKKPHAYKTSIKTTFRLLPKPPLSFSLSF